MTLSLTPVAQATTTILGSFPMTTTTFDVGKFTIVPPTSNSPGAWTFTSSNSNVATFTGSTLNIISVGSSNITASQAATGVYTARSRSTVLRVNPGMPTLGSFPTQSVSIVQKTFTLTPPTSTSSGAWSYSSSNSTIASISGNIVTLLDGGSVNITATQSSTLNWNAATTRMTLTVVALDPKIGTFGSITIMKDSVGSITLIPPSSLSQGYWTFTSSNPQVATVNGTTLIPVSLGTSIITATQAHVGNYASGSVSMTVTVLAALPTLGVFPDVTTTFSSTLPNTLTLVAPTSNSLGVWKFTSSDPTIATVNNATATLLKPGISIISATQSAMGSYGPSSPVSMTLTVVGTPTIGGWSNIEKVIKDPDFSPPPPPSDSSGTWTFTSSDPKVVEVVGSIFKVVGAGQTTITATQAATPIWLQATAQMMIRVYGNIPTIGTFEPIVAGVGDVPIPLKPPTSNSLGSWTYTSSNKSVVSISGNSLTVIGAGVATITAIQGPAGNYSQSNTVQTTVTVKPQPVVGDFSNLKITFGTIAPALVIPTSTSTTAWSFSSSNAAVVTISDSIIQMRGVGTATITAKQAGSTEFASITKTFTIQVLPEPVVTPTPKPTIKPTPTPTVKPVVKPTIKVSVVKRVITVYVTGATAKVTISGLPAKVGKNPVKTGVHTVVVTISGKAVYKKTFTIK